MKKLVLLTMLLTVGCSSPIPRATVMITNLRGNSGGSGSIIHSSKEGSFILTNAHVCEVARRGGLVHTDDGNGHFVREYRKSSTHDLCLITVSEDLKYEVAIASTPPSYLEHARAFGHPHLMPLIISEGHFSKKQVITLISGYRDCTEAEKQDPSTGMFCMIVGKLPVVKSLEAIAMSATIQPGSSGSAVYDSNNQVAAVVFAGAGDFAYGYAVPHEYITHFLLFEVLEAEVVTPDTQLDLTSASDSKHDFQAKIQEVCKTLPKDKVNQICLLVEEASKYHDLVR